MRNVVKYILIFIITVSLLTGLFTLSSSISKKSIKDNINESYNYIKDMKQYDNSIKDIDATKYDLLADTIILNLTVSQDSNKPLNSIMSSKYYDNHLLNYKNDLKEVNNKDVKLNEQYLRYWHGSIMIVKPLLTIFNYQQIIILNYILLSILLLGLLFVLFKKNKLLSLVTLISFVLTYSFVVPRTLEFTWNYYIMLIIGILVVLFKDKNKIIYPIFLISGICTCFFDFLTTETMTLVFPLVLLLLLKYQEKEFSNFKDTFIYIVKCCILWAAGYIFMWFSKWLLSSIILNINAMDYVIKDATFRINGQMTDSMFNQTILSVLNNCSNIMLFSIFKDIKNIICCIFVLLVGSFYFLFRKSSKRSWFPKILFIVGSIPIIRFIVLSNHSYVHPWFTYRALLPSIICFIYAFIYGIDLKLLKKQI